METPPFRRLAGRLGRKKGNWKTPGNRTFDESLDITVFAGALPPFVRSSSFLLVPFFRRSLLHPFIPALLPPTPPPPTLVLFWRKIHPPRETRSSRLVIVSTKLEIERMETPRYVRVSWVLTTDDSSNSEIFWKSGTTMILQLRILWVFSSRAKIRRVYTSKNN